MVEYLGWIAVLLYVIAGLQRMPRITISISLVANLLFIIKYYLQAHYSPFTLMLCNTICALLIMSLHEKYRIYLGVLSFSITASFVFMNFASYFDFLIVFAAACVIWAQINLESYIKYKIGVLMSQFLWIIFSSTISDHAMIATCLFISASNIFSLLVNMDKDIEEGKLILSPTMAPYLTKIINVAKVAHQTINNVKTQFNILAQKHEETGSQEVKS